jgi:hypothetical protein
MGIDIAGRRSVADSILTWGIGLANMDTLLRDEIQYDGISV